MEDPKMVSIDTILEKTNRYAPLIGLILSFVIAFVFTYTSFWYLALIAGIIGGLFNPRIKWGAISCLLGTALAWTVYIIVKDIWLLLDQVGEIVIGDSGMGIIIAILVILLGGLFGALGGSIGSEIRVLIKPIEGYGQS